MKKSILFLVVLFSVSCVFSQSNEEFKELSRKERKSKELERKYNLTRQLVEKRSFVIEANYLIDKTGNRKIVNPDINFVKIDSLYGVIQVGSDINVGPNGVGGITSKGRITNWELQKNEKRKTYHLMATVMSRSGVYELDVIIGFNGRASAKLTGSYSGNLTFEGDMVPLEKSLTFEGDSY